MSQVTVYSKVGCGQCQFTKMFLERHNIDYVEKNVSEDESLVDEVKALGFSSLPVVQIEGEEAFSGFQPDRLEKLVV